MTKPCPTCDITLAEILIHQKRSVAELGTTPARFMERHNALCFQYFVDEDYYSDSGDSRDQVAAKGNPSGKYERNFDNH
jgi:hypothetical protein